MRTRRSMRPAAAYAIAGALIFTLPATAIAAGVTSGGAGLQAQSSGARSTNSDHPVVRVVRRRREVVEGRRVAVQGRLVRGTRGHRVWLLEWRGGAWRWLATAHTTRTGRFVLRAPVDDTGSHGLRVKIPGDQAVGAAAGTLIGLRYTVASWYDDAGDTACGFHAYLGVANKTLPCGTKVTFVHAGRTVTATVDDRGPYVAGREFDLNQNTANALDMHGVETILTTG